MTTNESSSPANIALPITDTLGSIIARNARTSPGRRVYGIRAGDGWVDVTAGEFHDLVRAVAKGLLARGVGPGDAIAIMAANRYEWTVLDFALWTIGAFAVPIYESSSAEQIAWIVTDSGATTVIVDTPANAQRVAAAITVARPIWVMDEELLATLTADGAAIDEAALVAREAGVQPGDVATIIYTSGTTGRPKGCVLTHGNFVFMVRSLVASFAPQLAEPGAATVLFLPLAHVFGRVAEVWAAEGMLPLAHCPDLALLMADMQSFHPTFLISVPRLFEKVYNGAQHKAHAEGRGKIFDVAAGVAIDYSRAQHADGASLWLRAKHALFDVLVYGKLRQAMGGQVRYAISGGAALGERLGHFFAGIGLLVVEGYGLTETTAPTTFNRVEAVRIGSVGQPTAGTEVRLLADGEICLRGPHIMLGYHNNPTATREVLDAEGWFRTGDLGRLDDDGYLYIVGRKKEIIITSGGKNVVPAILEDGIRANYLVSNVMVVGEGRPFVAALIALEPAALAEWAAAHHLAGRTAAELQDDPTLHAEIQAAVDKANAAVSRAESVRAWRLLAKPFTEEAGQVTPTQKLKRAVIAREFADVIDSIYAK